MKRVRMPTGKENGDWWVVMHDLSLMDGRLRQLRPIHVLTHLAQQRIEKSTLDIFSYSIALENKLAAVRYMHKEFLKTTIAIEPDIYDGHRVKDYENEQFASAALEAFLNSVYSSLEIIAHLNRSFYPEKGLPKGFRRQSKKDNIFLFDSWEWLPVFYDLRSELGHNNSTLPILNKQYMIIEFKNGRDLQFFERGQKYQIPFSDIAQFSYGLFNLADTWAKREIAFIPKDIEVDVLCETQYSQKLENKKIKTSEIIGLLKEGNTKVNGAE